MQVMVSPAEKMAFDIALCGIPSIAIKVLANVVTVWAHDWTVNSSRRKALKVSLMVSADDSGWCFGLFSAQQNGTCEVEEKLS
jgi:hypothetical protein